ncbi:MAG TPA: AMP-binding protein [Planctomycetota bacterium]|nr:AMP-binding protein [Planctomycetota bacterium]
MLVCDFLSNAANRFPGKEACICGERRLTYGELEVQAGRIARALVDAGVQRGDRVGIVMENSPELVMSIFGILKANAAFVVVNPATKADKLAYVLDNCSATGLIVAGSRISLLEGVERHVKSLCCAIVCGGAPAEPAEPAGRIPRIDFERDVARLPAQPPPRKAIDIDLAAIIYTSGSTGRPKGVAMTHINVVSAVNSITEYLENVEDDVILNALPASFDYGLYQILMSTKAQATLVLERAFAYPYEIVRRVKDERVTGFPGVPTLFAILLQLKGVDPADLDSVRYVTNTAAALPPAHIQRLRGLFRKARLYSMYGVTECKRVSYLPPEQLDIRPTSVGRGMPNEEVYVVDENGNPVAPGVVGELVVRGANVMMGYWGLPEETARVLRPGRYPWERVLHTGDLFTMDEEGYLYFVARKDDIIKSRGEKVSPKEVENVICELTEVQEAAVVGVPDPILGEAVKAFVVVADGATLAEDDVIKHCTRRLENFMVPRSVEFRASLPKTQTGKVCRRELRSEMPTGDAHGPGESEPVPTTADNGGPLPTGVGDGDPTPAGADNSGPIPAGAVEGGSLENL